MTIEDVQHCFICGADMGSCGHLEEELMPAWKRNRTPKPEWTKRQRVYMSKREPVDPPKLARGRMPWPKYRITPEIALAKRGA